MKCFEDYIPMGILYIYKRDKGHRPVMVINTERLIASKVTFKLGGNFNNIINRSTLKA